jgi:SHS2 domain-containing protein
MSGEGGYETFEHTADVGLHVRAPSMQQLLEVAAQGMAEQMFDRESIRQQQERPIAVQADEQDELLVDWLSEVLYAFEGEQFVTRGAHVRSLGDGRASGVLIGEPYDRERHEVLLHIKAVTYHGLSIEQTPQGLDVRIIFDI